MSLRMIRIDGYDFNVTAFDTQADAAAAETVYEEEFANDHPDLPVSCGIEQLSSGDWVVWYQSFPGGYKRYL